MDVSIKHPKHLSFSIRNIYAPAHESLHQSFWASIPPLPHNTMIMGGYVPLTIYHLPTMPVQLIQISSRGIFLHWLIWHLHHLLLSIHATLTPSTHGHDLASTMCCYTLS